MRLRIQTFPPLPDLKAWFSLEVHQTPTSIRELKELLCSNLIVLKESCVSAREIQLLLDDFELLNESSFTAALRDGDLLCVKAQFSLLQGPKFERKKTQDAESPPQRKRKRAIDQDKTNKKQKNSREKITAESESSDSSASPSNSSSHSLSSSSSSSSASLSSSEGSDSDSSSPPSPQPSQPLKTLCHPHPQGSVFPSPTTKAKSAREGPFVPPGHGKATTHARNLRRRHLRAAQVQQHAESISQQTQAFHIPNNILSQTNAIPLGERVNSQTPGSVKGKERTAMIVDEGVRTEGEDEGGPEVMMASLGNKNKKKGYKRFLTAPVPKKIVFTEDGQPATSSDSAHISSHITQLSTSQLTISKIDPPASSKTKQPRLRLIPPSEIQERGELPANMFVTSVNVEADLWNSHDKKRKRKNRNKESCDYEDDRPGEETYDATQPAPSGAPAIPLFDWSQAERLFKNAPKVSQTNDLRIGQIVGWKSLDLNPQTFTPEILLIAAKVIEYSGGTSAKIQRFVRPIDPDSGLSGFLAPIDDEGSGEAVVEVEEHQWSDILVADWRVLQTS